MAKRAQKVPVTRQALIMRINRKLKKDNRNLKKNRNPERDSALGDYFIVDVFGRGAAECNVDVEKVGREIGALKAYEEMGE
jgi:hypothetical protein